LLPGLALGGFLVLLLAPCILGDAIGYYAWLHSLVMDGDLDLANQYTLFRSQISYQLFLVSGTGRIGNAFAFGSALLWVPSYAAALWLDPIGLTGSMAACPSTAGIGGAAALAVALGLAPVGLAVVWSLMLLAVYRSGRLHHEFGTVAEALEIVRHGGPALVRAALSALFGP
jgi:hypothetical protein